MRSVSPTRDDASCTQPQIRRTINAHERIFCRTSKMSHDGSWRAACRSRISSLWFRFGHREGARSVTDPGVGSGALFGHFMPMGLYGLHQRFSTPPHPRYTYPVAAHDAKGIQDDVVNVNYPNAHNSLHDFPDDAYCNGDNECFLPAHSPIHQQNENSYRREQYGISYQINNCTRPSWLTAKLRQNGLERDIVGVEGCEPTRR